MSALVAVLCIGAFCAVVAGLLALAAAMMSSTANQERGR